MKALFSVNRVTKVELATLLLAMLSLSFVACSGMGSRSGSKGQQFASVPVKDQTANAVAQIPAASTPVAASKEDEPDTSSSQSPDSNATAAVVPVGIGKHSYYRFVFNSVGANSSATSCSMGAISRARIAELELKWDGAWQTNGVANPDVGVGEQWVNSTTGKPTVGEGAVGGLKVRVAAGSGGGFCWEDDDDDRGCVGTFGPAAAFDGNKSHVYYSYDVFGGAYSDLTGGFTGTKRQPGSEFLMIYFGDNKVALEGFRLTGGTGLSYTESLGGVPDDYYMEFSDDNLNWTMIENSARKMDSSSTPVEVVFADKSAAQEKVAYRMIRVITDVSSQQPYESVGGIFSNPAGFSELELKFDGAYQKNAMASNSVGKIGSFEAVVTGPEKAFRALDGKLIPTTSSGYIHDPESYGFMFNQIDTSGSEFVSTVSAATATKPGVSRLFFQMDFGDNKVKLEGFRLTLPPTTSQVCGGSESKVRLQGSDNGVNWTDIPGSEASLGATSLTEVVLP